MQPLEQGKCVLTGGGIVNWRVVFSGFGFYVLSKGVRMHFPPVKFGEGDFIVENDDDELLRYLGIPGKILCTPGHSPDSISLLLDNGACFCGDVAFNLMPWLGTRYCMPLVSDMESLQKIRGFLNCLSKILTKRVSFRLILLGVDFGTFVLPAA